MKSDDGVQKDAETSGSQGLAFKQDPAGQDAPAMSKSETTKAKSSDDMLLFAGPSKPKSSLAVQGCIGKPAEGTCALGFVAISIHKNSSTGKKTLFIEYIHSLRKREGIGSQMFKALAGAYDSEAGMQLELLVKQGAGGVLTGAQHFYEKCGITPIRPGEPEPLFSPLDAPAEEARRVSLQQLSIHLKQTGVAEGGCFFSRRGGCGVAMLRWAAAEASTAALFLSAEATAGRCHLVRCINCASMTGALEL